MVRPVALLLSATILAGPCLTLCARPALAADGEESAAQVITVDNSGVESKLDTILVELQTVREIERERSTREILSESESEENEGGEQEDTTASDTLDVLRDIDGKIGTLVNQGMSEELSASEPLRAGSAVTSVAYASVSATSTHAQWAARTLPHVRWGQHYVFWQSGSSEYMMAWGDLSMPDDGTITGDAVSWVRWYYEGGTYTQRMQTGSGSLSLSTGGNVVLSDLGRYPLLDDGTSLIRQEVCLYAITAVVLFSLRAVWSFLLRMRGTGISD